MASVGRPDATLIRSPWTEAFRTLVAATEDDLLLASPFVKSPPIELILSAFSRRGVTGHVRVTILTNLRAESVLNGSMDLAALVQLSKNMSCCEVVHIPSLHAKVYVADDRMAVVTSGNLTAPGISGNLEYGVAFTEPSVVGEIRRDFGNYAYLGSRVSSGDIKALLDETQELKVLFKKAEQSARSQARRAFEARLAATRRDLLKHQARGRTTQSILCDTILFLLGQASLRTAELQPLVQRLQPDLCDDSIDRVIDGVHFGKRWKHHVRSAQQFLKRTGRVSFDGDRWHLVPRG